MKELVDAGEATPGEIVLLFAAGTDAERYEEALREEGLPTYRAAGAATSVSSRSPTSSRTCACSRTATTTRRSSPCSPRRSSASRTTGSCSCGAPPAAGRSSSGSSASFRRALAAGRAALRGVPPALRPARPRGERLGLERLCEQIVVEHDYDLAVLAQWDGRRRYANLRKLGRLARAYESLRGPDIEGFVGFLRDQEAAGAREVEAAAEEEGGDSVRLLTVHAAKGLEFKVVVLADAGRIPPSPAADEILCLPDGRFGFRVVNPATGKREGAFGWDDVREAEQTADQAERRRLSTSP